MKRYYKLGFSPELDIDYVCPTLDDERDSCIFLSGSGNSTCFLVAAPLREKFDCEGRYPYRYPIVYERLH